MTIDTTLRALAEAKEAQFHAVLVKAGLRLPTSTVADHRPRPVVYEAPVLEAKPVTVRLGVSEGE